MTREPSAARGFGRYARDLVAGWNRPEVNLLVVAETDSTNALAWRLHRSAAAREGSPLAPLAIACWEQKRGKGRRGRSWASPAGSGVYASLLLPKPGPGEIELLPLRVPAALCRSLDRRTRRPCRLKLTNDLLVDGRKIGGVLIEAAARGAAGSAAVVGFGVNLEPLADPPADSRATSLRQQAEAPPALAELTAELLGEVAGELSRPASVARAAREYGHWSLHREGDRLSCRTPHGEVRGAFRGFDERGFLRLQAPEGLRVVASGELIEGAMG